MQPHTRLIVVGAETPLGAEIARLAVAIGYEVVATAAEAPTDEPWTHGVEWRGVRLRECGDADAIVTVSSALDPDEVFAHAHDRGIVRLVFVDEGDAGSVSVSSDDDLEVVVLRPGTVSSEVTPDAGDGIPLSQVAMAALRTSVEEDRRGIYGPEDVAHIGDAVMIQ